LFFPKRKNEDSYAARYCVLLAAGWLCQPIAEQPFIEAVLNWFRALASAASV
jgi:hypothetical protein